MKKRALIVSILIFIFVLIFWRQMLFIFLRSLETPAKASGLVGELKLRVPEVKTFFRENQEDFNALKKFQEENQDWRYEFHSRDEITLWAGDGTNSEFLTLEKCSTLSDDFKKYITAFLQHIDKGGNIIVRDGISIEYATSEKDSRAFIFIKYTEKAIDNVDTPTHYAEMLDEHWRMEIVYYTRD